MPSTSRMFPIFPTWAGICPIPAQPRTTVSTYLQRQHIRFPRPRQEQFWLDRLPDLDLTIVGLGLNAIDGAAQVEAYIASVDRLKTLVESTDDIVAVHLTTHGFSNNLDEDRIKHAARTEGQPNFFVNPEGILAQLAGLRGRAVKRLEIEQNK